MKWALVYYDPQMTDLHNPAWMMINGVYDDLSQAMQDAESDAKSDHWGATDEWTWNVSPGGHGPNLHWNLMGKFETPRGLEWRPSHFAVAPIVLSED
jgi:hypothetical protein